MYILAIAYKWYALDDIDALPPVHLTLNGHEGYFGIGYSVVAGTQSSQGIIIVEAGGRGKSKRAVSICSLSVGAGGGDSASANHGSACSKSDGPAGIEIVTFGVCSQSDGPAGFEIFARSVCSHSDGPSGHHVADHVGIRTETGGTNDLPGHSIGEPFVTCVGKSRIVQYGSISFSDEDNFGTGGGREGSSDGEDPLRSWRSWRGAFNGIGWDDEFNGSGLDHGSAPGVGSRNIALACAHVSGGEGSRQG
jgi:hypothetical protein